MLNPGGTHAVDQFTNTNPADLIDEENSGTNGGENTCNVNPAHQFTNISAGGVSAHAHGTGIQELPPPCASASIATPSVTPWAEGEDLFPGSTMPPSTPPGAPPPGSHAPGLSAPATEGAPITVQTHGQHVQTRPRTRLQSGI